MTKLYLEWWTWLIYSQILNNWFCITFCGFEEKILRLNMDMYNSCNRLSYLIATLYNVQKSLIYLQKKKLKYAFISLTLFINNSQLRLHGAFLQYFYNSICIHCELSIYGHQYFNNSQAQ
jgi:hypothetical protein